MKAFFKNHIILLHLLLFLPLFPLADYNPFIAFLGLIVVLFIVMWLRRNFMSQKSIEMIKAYQNRYSTKLYQIALTSPAGVEPQRYEIFKSKMEAEELCKKYNAQMQNPYARWIVIEKGV